MTAKQAHDYEIELITTEPGYQCQHGLTGYAMYLCGLLDQALEQVGHDATQGCFYLAVEALEGRP